MLWMELKADQLGVRFRRQYGISKYIVDFYAPQIKLVIEVDGAQHFTPDGKQYDEIRTGSFESIGIQVIRFTNDEVYSALESVIERVRAVIAVRMVRSPSFQEGATGESQGAPGASTPAFANGHGQ